VLHTYSSYARGLDILVGTLQFLDMAPKGRDEDAAAAVHGPTEQRKPNNDAKGKRLRLNE
jgi:predicted dithiol-disulfide oxidoreductase (DUF899 family)